MCYDLSTVKHIQMFVGVWWRGGGRGEEGDSYFHREVPSFISGS